MPHRPDVYLQKQIPAKNMHRFYHLSIEPDLFGGVQLVRNWGRIGTKGQTKEEHFPSHTVAHAQFSGLHSRKLARGYRHHGSIGQ